MQKAAIIGCGDIAKEHAKAIRQLDQISMVAFCDIVEKRAEKFCKQFNGEYSTTDAERIFSDDSIDVVYICTRHDTHQEYCIRAAEGGKDILVEKPLALTPEACAEIGCAVENSNVVLMTAFKMRFYNLIQKVKELIPEPRMISMQMMDNAWPSDHWANDPEMGSGNVLSQGVHSCDIMRYIADCDPLTVSAEGANYHQKTGIIDNMAAVYQFENGVTGNLLQGDLHRASQTSKFFLQVYGEGCSAVLSDRFCRLTYQEEENEPETFTDHELEWSKENRTDVDALEADPFIEENRAFVQALEVNSSPPVDHHDGILATMMITQGFKSIETSSQQPVLNGFKQMIDS